MAAVWAFPRRLERSRPSRNRGRPYQQAGSAGSRRISPAPQPKGDSAAWRRPAGRWYYAAASISICINDKRDRQGGNGPNSRPASRSCGPSRFRAEGIGTPDRAHPSAPTAPPTSTIRRCRWRSGRRRERVVRAEPLCLDDPGDPSEPTTDRRPGLDHIAMTLDPRAAPAAVAALCNARSRPKGDRNAG
jgi:hypothetical protein